MNGITAQVFTLFLIVLIGLVAAKTNILTMDVRKKLSELLLHVTSPALILKSFQMKYSSKLLGNMGYIFLAAIAIIGGGFLLGKLLWRKSPVDKKIILQYASGFPNCGYLGYPVIGGLFGDIGIVYVAVFVMGFQCYMWTLGIRIFSGKSDKWYKPLTRPGIIAIAVGLLMFVFSVKLPTPIYNALSMVGGMTSPLAMLLVGAFLAESTFKEMMSEKHTYYLSLVRFILIPAIVYFALRPFGLEQEVFTTIVLISAMPAATNTVILATKFNANPQYASRLVTLTTLMSMVMIPLWMWIINL